MNRNLVCAAALILLGACGKASSDAAANGAADAGEVTLRPGQYAIEFVREATVPGQPSDPTHETESQCLSDEEVKHPETLFVPPTDSCRPQDAKASKGDFEAHLVCNLPEYSPSDFVFEVHGTYGRDGADLTGEANVEGTTLRETRTFRRQGDC